VRNPRKHVEAPGDSADGFGHQFARNPGQGDAVAGEALEKVDIGRQAAEVRSAIERDVDVAPPGVVDAHVLQLREHGEHARAGCARGIERAEPGVVHAPAEQQSVIG
jgi:hypothetical protein